MQCFCLYVAIEYLYSAFDRVLVGVAYLTTQNMNSIVV